VESWERDERKKRDRILATLAVANLVWAVLAGIAAMRRRTRTSDPG
jgi:hypothetical protein